MPAMGLTVGAIVIWSLLARLIASETSECDADSFGTNCRYACHCTGFNCDANGSCSGSDTCLGGWFGPACQYKDMAYGGSKIPEVTDGNDLTCLNNWQLRGFTLHYGGIFTWARVHFSIPDGSSRIRFRIKQKGIFTTCNNQTRVIVDSKTMDFRCTVNGIVDQVVFIGSAVGSMCSVYISGGRNIALKEAANQSTVWTVKRANETIAFGANLGVDGHKSTNLYHGQCLHTGENKTTRGSWTLRLSQPMAAHTYVLYNRLDSRKEALQHFHLVSYNASGSVVFKHVDTNPSPLEVYTVRHDPLVISSVNIITADASNVLNFCELEIYGDSWCQFGYYGLECTQQCNCFYQSHCFVDTGGCDTRCADGYIGADCQTQCPTGTFGHGCMENCSQFCADTSNGTYTCNHVNGDCLQGCEIGYQAPSCLAVCDSGKYGPSCELSCSPACDEGNDTSEPYCNRFNGSCEFGCDSGYWGSTCSIACRPSTYGDECRFSCSGGCAQMNDSILTSCHHITGVCLNGCANGFNGTHCTIRISDTASFVIVDHVKTLVIAVAVISLVSGLATLAVLVICASRTRTSGISEEV